MSLYSIPAKKHTAFYDHFVTPKAPVIGRSKDRKQAETSEGEIKSGSLISDDRSIDKTKEINRTYVVSALSKSSGRERGTPGHGRLTLQRRKTGAENDDKTMSENTENCTPAPEKRLTLQRRTRTGSIDKNANNDISKATERQRWVSGSDAKQPKVLSESNPRTPGNAGIFRSVSLQDSASRNKSKELLNPVSVITASKVIDRPSRYLQKQDGTTTSKLQGELVKSQDKSKTYSTPTRKTVFENITSKKDVFERLAGREDSKVLVSKSASLERPKTQPQVTVEKVKAFATPRSNKFPVGVQKAVPTSNLPPTPLKKTTPLGSSQLNGNVSTVKSTTPCTAVTAPAPTAVVNEPSVLNPQESMKMENSAVTVAVRLRPFNTREKTEKASQVIFMENQETVVQHPDTKQSYSFSYDFSFCSVDKSLPSFSSQQTVYERLAQPLLERAFQGFNICLFAYGQTGSGKSYTMMGFGEETGVIPRFCDELFFRLSSTKTQEVTCHLEMSYFEVYNEKIHDLLVMREEPNHKRLPVSGPVGHPLR